VESGTGVPANHAHDAPATFKPHYYGK